MSWMDLAGYVASGLVFMTFYMKEMVPLRLVALCSNVAFLIYGGGLHLQPIVFLHGALIPINVCRLTAALKQSGSKAPSNALLSSLRLKLRGAADGKRKRA